MTGSWSSGRGNDRQWHSTIDAELICENMGICMRPELLDKHKRAILQYVTAQCAHLWKVATWGMTFNIWDAVIVHEAALSPSESAFIRKFYSTDLWMVLDPTSSFLMPAVWQWTLLYHYICPSITSWWQAMTATRGSQEPGVSENSLIQASSFDSLRTRIPH